MSNYHNMTDKELIRAANQPGLQEIPIVRELADRLEAALPLVEKTREFLDEVEGL